MSVKFDAILSKLRERDANPSDAVSQSQLDSETAARESADIDLSNRTTILENNELKILYYKEINTTSGSITKPTNSNILLGDFPEGLDAVVETIVNGKPTGLSPTTGDGSPITVTSFDSSGNYTISGTPTSFPIALLFVVKIKAIDYSNISIGNVIEAQVIDSASIDYVKSGLSIKVDSNSPISPSTRTKITYDSKGLVTSGTDAAITDLSDITISEPESGQALIFNGVKWNNQDLQIPASAGSGVNIYLTRTSSGISDYDLMSFVPDMASEIDESVVVNNGTVDFEHYITDVVLDRNLIDSGAWDFNIFTYVSDNTHITTLGIKVYSRTSGGVETLLFSGSTIEIDETSVTLYTIKLIENSFSINPTDKLVVKFSATTDSITDVTVHLVHSGTEHYTYINTPLVVRHNDLSQLQGGSSNQYYHLTQAEYTGTGSGVFVKTTSPNITTPTGIVSGDIVEGTNLYYTNARFDARFATKTTTDLTEGSNLYYTSARFNSAFAGKTTTDLSEGTNLYYTQSRFDTAFSGKTTSNLTEGSNLYFTNARVIASVLTGYVSGSGTITSSDSVLSAIQKLNGNIQLVTGATVFQGLWNANTNSPALSSGVGTKGFMYKVSVAGSTSLDGITQWNVGDQLYFDGTSWDKIDGIANEVLSVNGNVGAVPLTGTSNRIIISVGNVFDISSSYVGQSSITTVGTLISGSTGTGFTINLSTSTINGSLGVSNGGTGITSYTIGDLLYANSTNSLSQLADIATGNVLITGGVGVSPSYGKVGLATHISGILLGSNGGTGINNGTFTITIAGNLATTGLFNTTLAQQFTGTVTLPNATSTLATLALSEALTNKTSYNGLVVTPNTGVVTSGTWNGATIAAVNGGTGQTVFAVGDLLYADTTTTLSKLSDVATGSILISGGTNTAPSWSSSPTLTTSLTVPLMIGGTAVGSSIEHRSTTAAGTTTAIAHSFTGGTNGGTIISSLYNDGQFLIGTTTRNPTALGLLRIGQGTSTIDLGQIVSGQGAIWIGQSSPSTSNFTIQTSTGGGGTTTLNSIAQITLGVANSTRILITSNSISSTLAVTSSNIASQYSFATSANTAQTAGSESLGVNFNTSAIIQHATGALTLQRNFLIQAPTYSFVAASTLTDAVTFEVNGSPIQGTNATITRSWGARLFGNTYTDKLFAGATGISPTAFIDTAASTTGAASMRIRSGVAPTSPNDGDIWNDSTFKILISNTSGINQKIVGNIFTQTADKTFSNTTTQTSLVGTGQGTNTLPANFWTVGKTIEIIVVGIFSRTNGNFTYQLKLGSTNILTSITQSPTTQTNETWIARMWVTCRSTGVTGTVIAGGEIGMPISSSFSLPLSGTITIDTTAPMTLDFLGTTSTANAGNSMTSQIFITKVL